MSAPADGRASGAPGADVASRSPARAPLLAEQRDDGVLAGRFPAGVVPLPETLGLALAVLVALVAPLSGAPGPSWAWVAGGTSLALLGCCGRGWPRLRWAGPALLRALEYGAVLLLAGGSAWTYTLLCVLAFHHYDIVYRLRLRGEGPPRWLAAVTGGWPVRLVVLVVAAALQVAQPAAVALSLVLGPVYLTESIMSWIAPRPAREGR